MLKTGPSYRHRCHKVGLLLLIFSIQIGLKAQEELNFRSFAKKEGLSQSTVFAIAQDSIGYMWFGTRDGLNRFDGLEVKIYQHDPEDSLSLPENEIRSLFFDKVSNGLLVGTAKGLARFDHKANSFVRYYISADKQMPDNMTIRAILRDVNKHLWVASSEGLFLQEFGGSGFKNVKYNGLDLDPWSLLAKEDGSIWVGTSAGLLNVSLSETKSLSIKSPQDSFPFLEELASHRIGAIKSDRQGNLWLGTESNGLFLWKTAESMLKRFPIAKYSKTAISYEAVRAINIDNTGKIWVGTRKGLNILNPSNYEVNQIFFEKARSESISDNSIRSIFFESNNSAWIGTYYGGVNYTNPNLSRFIHFEPELGKNSLSYPVVSSFCELGEGKFLIGTEGGGINKFDRNTQRFSNDINEAIPEIAELNIKCIARQADTIWMGTYAHGLVMYNLATGKHKIFRHDPEDASSIPSDNVYGLVLQGDKLWIGTFGGGLSRMDTKSGTCTSWQNQKGSPMSLSDNRIRALIHDSSDRLWIGTDDGLNVIQTADISSNEFQIFLAGKRINSARQSKSGNAWIGTYQHGVFLISPEGKILESYGLKDGLPSLSVFGIVEDGFNAVWFSTNHGIAKLNLRDKSITAYNNSDGLKTLEFNFNAHLKSEAKEIYFGSTKGFTIFDPQKIKINTFVSPLAFNFLKLGAKEIQVKGPDNILQQSINYTREINLPFDRSNFTLSFAALDFQNPEHNYFSYRLDGIDKEWNIQRGISSASYTIQKEGSYVFNLKVANSDGIWNPTIKKLRINILPPFWRTKWAYFFYFILFCLAAFVLYRILKLQRKLRYEEIEKKHQKALNESKLRFFTDITHEFRTPLTLILGPLEDLINGRAERSQEKLKSIHKNTQRLLTLINQLMDFRRLDNEHYSLKREKIELNSFLNEMWTSFMGMANEKKIDFQLHTPDAPLLLSVDKEKLEKIYFNILSNAFKFTPVGGQIIIETVLENGWVSSKIKNTGEKINEEHSERIFERFFESNDRSTSGVKGSGIGLSLSKKLIELHGGKLYLVDIPTWEGACFHIDLPLQDSELQKPASVEDFEHPEFQELSGSYQVFEHPSGKRARILLVEDNPEILAYVEDLISDFYEVFIANDGQEGIDMAQQIMPDLVISDIMMPVKSGTELCQELKGSFTTSHIPIILLTAKTAKDAEIMGLETGADKYIKKPFHPYELHLHIKNLLELKYRIRHNFGKLLKLEPDKLVFSSEDDLFLKNAMKLIEQNMDKSDFRIEDFAREMGVSRALLFIKLRALSNLTPNNFVKKVRLKRAAQILEDSRKNVSEVSYMVGFQDPKYFSKCFKSSYGLSPNEYRKQATESRN